jgi:phosphotransferase system HPr-like phosphotransfer protein
MRSRKVIVQNEHGIHARVAIRVLEKTRNLDSQVTICKGCVKADPTDAPFSNFSCLAQGRDLKWN